MTGKTFFRYTSPSWPLSGTDSRSLMQGTRWKAPHPRYGVRKPTHPTAGREVVFVPMQHTSSAEDHAETRLYLDSLKAGGYVTFSEETIPAPFHVDTIRETDIVKLGADPANGMPPADSIHMDASLRKCRRELGFTIGADGCADPKNASIKGSGEKRNRRPKIAVVYGKVRSSGIVYSLAKDHGFRIDRRYKAQNDYR